MNNIFFKEMHRVKKRMDDALDHFLDAPKLLPKLYPGKEIELFHNPMIDVVEKANIVVVKAELPGLTKNEIHIGIKNGMLEIKGQRRLEENKGYLMQERSYTGFYRLLQLPAAVKVENADSKYENGILTVTLPKKHPGIKSLEHKTK